MEDSFQNALNQLKERGWGIIKNCATSYTCESIAKSLDYPKLPVNLNQPYPTLQGGTKFNNNVLACSKDAFKLVTRQDIRELASEYIQDNPILKCIRTYSIAKKFPLFEWHADNVHPVTFEADESIGINCILYLEDDLERTFWVADSIFHKKDKKHALPLKEEIKQWELDNKVIKIAANKGDMVIFSQDIYHRHITDKMPKLDALWFQIVGEKKGTTERLIVDSSFIPNDLKILNYLGSGRENIGFSNPSTKFYQLPVKEMIKIGSLCLIFVPISILISSGKKIDQFIYFKLGVDLSSTRGFFKKKIKNLLSK